MGIKREGTGYRTSVDAEYLVVDDHAQREIIEHVGEMVPNAGIPIFPRALGIEAIRLSDSAGLVVSTDQMNTVGVS